MADILIRMEMPKSCEDCPLVEETENYYGDTMSRVCNLIYKGYTSEAPKGRRRADCPLYPLPEGHGRLGDLDRLFEVMGQDVDRWIVDEVSMIETDDVLDAIQNAPTIIPAEGGGEE